MKSVINSFPTIFLISLVLYGSGYPTKAFSQDKASKIDELMTRIAEDRKFNGSVLVAENGEIIYRKGFGYANMDWNIYNTPDTKFRIASITKQFTAMQIMQLVEEGKIKLDGKIIDYLPDYRIDVGVQFK
ncbi:serine hydrolase domain-containing protein [Bacteroidota bacterium]